MIHNPGAIKSDTIFMVFLAVLYNLSTRRNVDTFVFTAIKIEMHLFTYFLSGNTHSKKCVFVLFRKLGGDF